MNHQPGEQVIVLDTTSKPIGSAIIQAYLPESRSYMVLFHYPGKSSPEEILLPAHRLVTHPIQPPVEQ